MQSLPSIFLSGKEMLPLIEGGKGISISTGLTAGAWAAAGGAGTFSGVNADYYDEKGKLVPMIYRGKTRAERHKELIHHAIQGGITQAKIAYERARGQGRIHMNVLWEMGAAEPILEGILEKTHHLIHGITCGAGMPYRLAEIAARFKIYYIPIISSARAFSALWRRAYSRVSDWLGGVVYEDPWLAGGHNGLSNQENPRAPQDPYLRVLALRQTMREFGLDRVPIIMAGGVWHLNEWDQWLGNDLLGSIGFQFGTRPLLTQESPISEAWKRKLLTLKKGDILLNRFSPTGFYSSAIRNDFLKELEQRSEHQVSFSEKAEGGFDTFFPLSRGRGVYLAAEDELRVQKWMAEGFVRPLKTPDQTLVFVSQEKALEIHQDQVDCMGCLSACRFSNWQQPHYGSGETVDHHSGDLTTHLKPDPRSFCIQKTLQNVAHGQSIEDNLLFAGHNAYRFADDPFYEGGFIPSVEQLVRRIETGA